jgi:hypothetical protein
VHAPNVAKFEPESKKFEPESKEQPESRPVVVAAVW